MAAHTCSGLCRWNQVQAPALSSWLSASCGNRKRTRPENKERRTPCVRAAAFQDDRRAVLVGTLGAAVTGLLPPEAFAKGSEASKFMTRLRPFLLHSAAISCRPCDAEFVTLYGQAKGPTDYGSQEGKLSKEGAK